jgi:uncharacterized protein YdaU (DUF1376 family)
MWRTPHCRVPNDMDWLAKRLRAKPDEIKAILGAFCVSNGNHWTQKRLMHEYEYVTKAHERASVAAKIRWEKKKALKSSNAPTPTPTPIEERKIKYGADAPIPINETSSSRLFREGKPMLVSMGTSEKTAGSIIGRWLKVNGDAEGILAAISYARDFVPIEPIAYVTKLLQQKVKPNGTASASERAFQAAERLRQMENGSERSATGGSVVSFPVPQR